MHLRTIGLIFTSLFCSLVTLAMESQPHHIPVTLSSRPAPWTKRTSPHAFDATAHTTAKRIGCVTSLTTSTACKEFIGTKSGGCALSPDGHMLALPDRAFKTDLISLFDVTSGKETITSSNGKVLHLAISNKQASVMALVEHNEPSAIKIRGFTNAISRTMAMENMRIDSIALNPNGTLLAVVMAPRTSERSSTINFVAIIDLNTNSTVSTLGARDKNIVNLAFGEQLLLEFDGNDGCSEIKTVALFDSARLDEQQTELLKSINRRLVTQYREGIHTMLSLDDEQLHIFDSLPNEHKETLAEVVSRVITP